MFDFAWSEIAVIGVVALIAIGPKDMPMAIKAVTNAIKKARRMAGEFQTHIDEMVREANLDEVRKEFNQIRNFDLKSTVERTIDADGSLRSAFSDPIAAHPPQPAGVMEPGLPLAPATEVASYTDHLIATPAFVPASAAPVLPGEEEEAPSFIPPAVAGAGTLRPSFVPPGAARHGERAQRF